MPGAPYLLGTTETFAHDFVLNGAPWNLTGVTVTLVLTDPGGTAHSFAASVTDAPNGRASYTTATTDLSTVGNWLLQWKATGGGNTGVTLPETITVETTAGAPAVTSSFRSYASVEDMGDTFDVRTLCQLCSDVNTPIAAAALTAGDIPTVLTTLATNRAMTKALLGGSGMVESACLVGKRYDPAHLAGLADSAGGILLRQIVCDLAMYRLIQRRPNYKTPLPASYQQTLEYLQLLSLGERVFGLDDTLSAGLLEDPTMQPPDYDARGEVVTLARRLFGRRANQRFLPGGIGNDGGGW